MLVDPAAGTREPAFDDALLAPRLPPPPGNRSTLREALPFISSWPGTRWSSVRSASIGAADWTAAPASGPTSRRRASGQPGRLRLRQGHRRRADHMVTMPDTMEYFIDSTSTVDTPPVFRVGD